MIGPKSRRPCLFFFFFMLKGGQRVVRSFSLFLFCFKETNDVSSSFSNFNHQISGKKIELWGFQSEKPFPNLC